MISAILVALQDKAFATGYHECFSEENIKGDDSNEEYNPNKGLVDSLTRACGNVLKRNSLSGEKKNTILYQYESIKQVNALVGKTLPKTKKSNHILKDLIDDLNQNVMPYVNSDVFDDNSTHSSLDTREVTVKQGSCLHRHI